MTATMAKRKPEKNEKPAAEKQVLYLEIEADLKRRLVRLAELPHRNRKLTAEATIALRRYVEDEEAKEELPPIDDD